VAGTDCDERGGIVWRALIAMSEVPSGGSAAKRKAYFPPFPDPLRGDEQGRGGGPGRDQRVKRWCRLQ
jgi:hypothetical protein